LDKKLSEGLDNLGSLLECLFSPGQEPVLRHGTIPLPGLNIHPSGYQS
jgi:hypothetical protein